jgi:hypothetical protein
MPPSHMENSDSRFTRRSTGGATPYDSLPGMAPLGVLLITGCTEVEDIDIAGIRSAANTSSSVKGLRNGRHAQ